jgi:hypothetical protein
VHTCQHVLTNTLQKSHSSPSTVQVSHAPSCCLACCCLLKLAHEAIHTQLKTSHAVSHAVITPLPACICKRVPPEQPPQLARCQHVVHVLVARAPHLHVQYVGGRHIARQATSAVEQPALLTKRGIRGTLSALQRRVMGLSCKPLSKSMCRCADTVFILEGWCQS